LGQLDAVVVSTSALVTSWKGVMRSVVLAAAAHLVVVDMSVRKSGWAVDWTGWIRRKAWR
jgi:hypothetical protein